MLITENRLDEWVRGNSRDAQGVIVELVLRLVATSSPRPKERRFPLGDSIGQHGADGILDVDFPFEPFVPEGRSFWEIGTGLDAGDKATSDYRDLVTALPPEVRIDSTFVFVTPLSGRRDWEHTWKDGAQASWLAARRAKGDWKEVRVIDGTKLIDWVDQFPPVEFWLAERILGLRAPEIETTEQRWSLIRSFGEPPPLVPQVFLANRAAACAKMNGVFAGTTVQLRLDTHFPEQAVDFVAAYLAALDEEHRTEAAGRCLIISGADTWVSIAAQRESLVLVADSRLDLTGETGTKLIQQARRAGHAVIFGAPPGGIPDPTSVALLAPRSHQLKEALEKAGYSEERARTLAQKSGENLGTLLRCIQNLSLIPEWADSSTAAELAVAAALGSWAEDSHADRAVVEGMAGKPYGEWIGTIRKIALHPGTPLIQRDGKWKFVARYEGWYALGPRLFDEQLDRLKGSAVSVLQETHPHFELPKTERYAASIRGKMLAHSHLLRTGLAESLALLGSHPKALTSCSVGKAEAIASIAVRAILAEADWLRWASVADLLPLLAEAAPNEFLSAVEDALNRSPCPFDEVFAQEGGGITGQNYMTGVLWALETLAWAPDYLTRAVLFLGALAARDPGGQWGNRPANSLTTILLPWLPQTCAPIARRGSAAATLLVEQPDAGWALILGLLPETSATSIGSRRPTWRNTIPEDWSDRPTESEYWEQVALYSGLAVTAAKSNQAYLCQLVEHIDHLTPPAREELLIHLRSSAVIEIPEAERVGLWTALVELVTRHRKFAQAEWAMTPEQVDELAALTERLAPNNPTFRYRRLFTESEFDLYEEKGSYEEQRNSLELRRLGAIREVAEYGGAPAVLAFAATVESPRRVGTAFGVAAPEAVDEEVLPDLLDVEQPALAQFAGGFVQGRFESRGWPWLDQIDMSRWTPAHIGQLLSFLPFTSDTWERAARLLGSNESAYWTRTLANPYQAETGLPTAIGQLIAHGRPRAAVRCLHRMFHAKHPLDSRLAVRALLAAVRSEESASATDGYETVEIIKALQQDATATPDDLFRVEWAYLPLLDRRSGATPQFLERRLAAEPAFFCEVIRLVFRSKKVEASTVEPTENEKNLAANAYRLLSGWRVPPGSQEGEAYDGGALVRWLDSVRQECTESGHLEIAMTMVGHVLTHVPSDPDGLWIHRSAAAVLDAPAAGDLRDGFRGEVYNSRGVHYVDPTGKPEMEISDKHRARADALDNAGFPRFAATLRQLAETYRHEAERLSSRDEFDNG